MVNVQNDHRLLDDLIYISSTSGGSFTNALYSAYIHQGKSFEDVYKKLLAELDGEHLVREVFVVLDDDSQWK